MNEAKTITSSHTTTIAPDNSSLDPVVELGGGNVSTTFESQVDGLGPKVGLIAP